MFTVRSPVLQRTEHAGTSPVKHLEDGWDSWRADSSPHVSGLCRTRAWELRTWQGRTCARRLAVILAVKGLVFADTVTVYQYSTVQ